jgi:hypothetical protein
MEISYVTQALASVKTLKTRKTMLDDRGIDSRFIDNIIKDKELEMKVLLESPTSCSYIAVLSFFAYFVFCRHKPMRACICPLDVNSSRRVISSPTTYRSL